MTGTRATASSDVYTFLFTDVVGSVTLWSEDPEAMAASLQLHDMIVRRAIADNDGTIFSTAGDSFGSAFTNPRTGATVACRIRDELADADWPGPALTVRSGIHLGEAQRRDNNFFGIHVNLAARVSDAAHGGQIIVTQPAATLLDADSVIEPTIDLGRHELRGVDGAVGLRQIGTDVFPALRISTGGGRRLPTPRSNLIGRDSDVLAVRKQLLEHRLVSLTGPGGCGKTRLAIEVGAQEEHDTHVFFVDLSHVDVQHAHRADLVTSAFVEALGLTMSALMTATDQIVHFLTDRDALLIADNCEHVVDPCTALIDELLQRCQKLKVLTTTQEALEVEGEIVWRVSSLPTGPESAATRLFVERAIAATPDLDLNQLDDRELIHQICHNLDGIPLAIELAAARTRSMDLADILAHLDERLHLLSTGRRRTNERHQTLQATVQWSHDLLEADEATMLRRLAVFSGGFDADDVAAIADLSHHYALELLDALVAKSLVDRYAAGDRRARFRLLETIRLYALAQLIDHDEEQTTRQRHLDHFLADQANLGLSSGYDLDGDWRRTREFTNLNAAGEFALANRQPDAAVAIAAVLAEPFGRRGEAQRCLDWLQSADNLPLDLEVMAYAVSGYLRFTSLMGADAALADAEHAIELAGDEHLDGLPLAYCTAAAVRTWTDVPSDIFDLLDRAERIAGATPEPNRDGNRSLVAVFRSNAELALGLPHEVPSRCVEVIDRAPNFGFRHLIEAQKAVAELQLGRLDDATRTATSFSAPSPATAWGYWNDFAHIALIANVESPNAAGRLAIPMMRDLVAQRPLLLGDCIQLLAYLHYLDDNRDRARHLTNEVVGLQSAPTMAPTVVPAVYGWDLERYQLWVRGKAERLADIERLLRGIEIQPLLFSEEAEHWDSSLRSYD